MESKVLAQCWFVCHLLWQKLMQNWQRMGQKVWRAELCCTSQPLQKALPNLCIRQCAWGEMMPCPHQVLPIFIGLALWVELQWSLLSWSNLLSSCVQTMILSPASERSQGTSRRNTLISQVQGTITYHLGLVTSKRVTDENKPWMIINTDQVHINYSQHNSPVRPNPVRRRGL